MTPSESLLTRLRAMGLDIPAGSVIQRTYAGYWQRKEGAWSWFILTPDGAPVGSQIGSQHAVTRLLHTPLLATQFRRGDDINIGWVDSAIQGGYHLWLAEGAEAHRYVQP